MKDSQTCIETDGAGCCMNILTATDDNYAAWCGVMLTSLIKCNRERDIHAYILCDSVSEREKSALQKLGIHVHLIDLDWSSFENWVPRMEGGSYLSRTTWARLGIADLLPEHVEKILHLDVDTIVMGSLAELYDMDIKEHAAVVIDEYRDGQYIGVTGRYFNAGVLLINMRYFRENDIKQQCIDFIGRNRERILFHDQDTLNAVLDGKVLYASRKFNLTSSGIYRHDVLDMMRPDVTFDDDEKVQHAADVRIVHFTGKEKPWRTYIFCPNPYVRHWRKVWRSSYWRTKPLCPVCQRVIDRFKVFVKNILFKTRLTRCPIHFRVEAYPDTRWNRIKSFFSLDSYR